MNFLTDNVIVRFDEAEKIITISHPNSDQFPRPLVQISKETYDNMEFEKFAAFLGARVLLLMPSAREVFREYIDGKLNA
jgi:hypothetical protein